MTNQALRESNKLAEEAFDGVHTLSMLAGWAFVLSHRRQVVKALMAFEATYGELLQHQEAGRLSGLPGVSKENLACLQRLCDLIRPGLHKTEVKRSATEIKDLADHLLKQ